MINVKKVRPFFPLRNPRTQFEISTGKTSLMITARFVARLVSCNLTCVIYLSGRMSFDHHERQYILVACFFTAVDTDTHQFLKRATRKKERGSEREVQTVVAHRSLS